ncbi:MAG: glycosyltransferase [Bdellovibrionales bacterium]|nr:glycosyltransferase [Bdellovibrionales bacterium]
MRILIVTGEFPFPADSGAKLRQYHLIRELSRSHYVFLCSLSTKMPPLVSLNEIRKFCDAVHVEVRSRSILSKCFDLAASLCGTTPYIVRANTSNQLKRILRDLLEAWKIDLVQIDELCLASNVGQDFLAVPMVLDAHNCEGPLLDEIANRTQNPLIAWYRKKQARKLCRYEERIAKAVDGIAAVTTQDSQYFKRFNSNVIVVENGTAIPAQDTEPQRSQYELLFVGTLSYPPNEEGLLYFVSKILPLIAEQIPNVTLRIIGRKPGRKLRSVACGNVRIETGVDDLDQALNSSSCMVVPLLAGGGSRLKILEAFAHKLPVISTSKGAEGLHVQDKQHLFLADSASSFANAVIGVLRQPQQSQAVTKAAREYVERYHAWNLPAKALEGLLCRAAKRSVPDDSENASRPSQKVLITIPHKTLLGPQGHRARFDGILNLLDGCEFHLLLPRGINFEDLSTLPQSQLHFFDEPKLLNLDIPFFLDYSLSFQKAAAKVCREESVDFVIFDFPWGLSSFRSKNLIPSIYLSHGVEREFSDVVLRDRGLSFFPINAMFKAAISWIERRACHQADAIVAMSERDSALLSKTYNVPPSKILPLPQPVKAQVSREPAEPKRSRFKLPTDATLLVFHGSFRHLPNRTAIELLENSIAPLLAAFDKNARIVVAGLGVEPKISKNLIYLGFVDDLPSLLAYCDIAVVPVTEGSGVRMKILDYFHAGIPVVSTKKGIEGLPVCNGIEAVVTENNPTAVFEGITRLLESVELRSAIAERAATFLDRSHSPRALRELLWLHISQLFGETYARELLPDRAPGHAVANFTNSM